MIAVNATSLSHTTGPIKLSMEAVPSSTDLSLELVTTGNGCGDAVSGFVWRARQPVTSPFKTSETPQEELADLLRRHNIFQDESSSSDKVLSELPCSQPGYLLAKDSLHFCVKLHLKELGVDTKGLHWAIDGIVEKMLDAPSAVEFVKVLQGLDKEIQSGHRTAEEVIERFRFRNYTRAAVHQQGVSSQAACWKQTMEAVYQLLLSMTQPKHSVGINEHCAGNASSQQIQGAVHQGSPAPGSEDSSQWPAHGGALTEEGPHKPIGNKQQATGSWPSGAMADDMSIEVDASESEGFLPDLSSAVSTVSAVLARIALGTRKPRLAIAMGAAGTTATLAVYWLYKEVMASLQPAPDAALDVQASNFLPFEDREHAAVPAPAGVPGVQQRGVRISERGDLNQRNKTLAPSYRRTGSGEEAYERAEASERGDLNQRNKTLAPSYGRTNSGEEAYKRAEASERDDLNQLDEMLAPSYGRTNSGEATYERADASKVSVFNHHVEKPASVDQGIENPEAEVLRPPVKKPARLKGVPLVRALFLWLVESSGHPFPLGKR